MKKILTIGAAALAFFFAATSFSANTVNITGNLKMDGYLMIDIKWKVDTAKYSVVQRTAINQVVYDEIWEAVMPKLVANMGEPGKCKQSKFTKLAENKKLIEQRKNGTKVYSYDATLKFECLGGYASSTDEITEDRQFSEFSQGFHDGFSNEANSF